MPKPAAQIIATCVRDAKKAGELTEDQEKFWLSVAKAVRRREVRQSDAVKEAAE